MHRNKRRKKSIWGPAGWQCAHANGCLSVSDNNLLVFAHTYMCLISSSKACWRSDKRMNNAMKKVMMGVNVKNSHNFSSKDLYFTGFPPHPSSKLHHFTPQFKEERQQLFKARHTHVTMTQLINTHSSRLQTYVFFFFW